MKTQNLIKRKLSQPESVVIVQQILEDNKEAPRSAIAKRVCQHFGFLNAWGRPQKSGCLKALRELERVGRFRLPQARRPSPQTGPRRCTAPVEEPRELPSALGQIQELELIRVQSETEVRIWNELMIQEHPRGAGPLVGAQMRYLIRSEHGWLGGLGFSASALHLKARDQWIGWEAQTRQHQLHRVINLSRFLIRPSVRCPNLASQVLGLSLRRVADDFELRYSYRPWLVESFVDQSRYRGTCYQASNWIEVGQTQGRGRQDRAHHHGETVKAIYLYPLENNFRHLMGVERPIREALEMTEGLEGDQWAQNEFGGAQLGDERLSKRLVECARIQAEKPAEAFSGAAQGNWPLVKGYYRMIDKPDDSAITMDAILAPHRERTVQRMKGQETVLCIQDGSDLNYNSLTKCEGLGVIGTNQTSAQSRGLHLHSTFVVTTDGLPLGLLGAQCEAPEGQQEAPEEEQEKAGSRKKPIEQRKNFCWIEGLRASNALAAELPSTRQVCTMDREADFYELFCEPRHRQVELLVRAKHDRRTDSEYKLFETLRRSEVRDTLTIQIPRQSARPKRSKQKARPQRLERTAQVALRYEEVELSPPCEHKDKAPVKVCVVHLREETPPPGETPLEWFLLTTIVVTSNQIAEECIRWYRRRWRIEDWHRVLKSGCGTEKLAYRTAERLKRGIAINMVIAWRIMLMTLLGRECPELPAEVLFSYQFAVKKVLTIIISSFKLEIIMRPQKPFPPGTTERMEQLLKSVKSLDEYRRIQSIYFRSKYEFRAEQIADMVGLNLQTIRNLHASYLKGGEKTLQLKGAGGRRQALLSLEEEDTLLADFEVDGQLGAVVEVHRVQRAYEKKVGQPVAKSTVYRLLHRHGWRKLAPRPHHPKGNEESIKQFKKTSVDL